ncbi:MAG: hypothetical protein RMA76_25340 [Deltaproteobacteria bacterium]|jgi:hypothetical protein
MRFALALLCLLLPSVASAKTVKSADAKVPVARVVKIVELVDKPHIKVNLVVQDLGGSTDVSPTQRLFFTLYSKGEMFSTDAAFDLGPVFGVKSAKRKSGGVYEVTLDDGFTGKTKTMTVDAREAIVAMKKVSCDDFDCAASKDFAATIEVSGP